MMIYTVGHGRRTFEEFLAIVDRNGLSLVVDVRWKPASRWTPWANRKRLEAALGERYVYDGARLGNPAHFDAPAIAESDRTAALDDLELRARGGEKVVIMCAETKAAGCHRVAIAADLGARGLAVHHL